ncbi:hypothetical protein [Rhodospira trueperi]|uniref:HPt domain-containing protein n=1 Tax=Rhodospira trueperi TaxID=69960 RepID=A0A1G7FRW2_9PROT|nr:hypothetical protein [Rhodospira trueperi]SDE78651.1 hypothetical protein SAMN05421720_11248 [Rhodospira trueperi]
MGLETAEFAGGTPLLSTPLEHLRLASEALDRRAGADTGQLGEDVAVVCARLNDVARLAGVLGAMERPMARDARDTRHDLMNALGAIDNFSELIALDHNLEEAQAVRAAVRVMVDAVEAMRSAG